MKMSCSKCSEKHGGIGIINVIKDKKNVRHPMVLSLLKTVRRTFTVQHRQGFMG